MNRTLLVFLVCILLISCTNQVNLRSQHLLTTPTLDVIAGDYSYEFTAQITNMEEGTSAYFTLDGSEPTEGSLLYNIKVGIPILEGHTRIRVIKVDNKGRRSPELATCFTVTLSGPEYEQVNTNYFVKVAHHGNSVYFTDSSYAKGLYKFNISTQTTELLVDKDVSHFRILDNNIFYLSRYDLRRKDLSTGEDVLFLSLNSEDLLADEEWIYYKEKNGWRLSRINVHTHKIEHLNDVQTEAFCLIDNYVVYTEWAEGIISQKIYSYNFNNEETLLISPDSAQALQPKEGYIYYSNWSDGRHIYRIKPNGTEKSKVVSRGVMEYVVLGGWIYYSDMYRGEGIYRAMLDGLVEQTLGGSGNFLRFSRGHLYYRHSATGEFFRINVFTLKQEQLGQLGSRSVLYFYDGNAYYTNATGLHCFSEKGLAGLLH